MTEITFFLNLHSLWMVQLRLCLSQLICHSLELSSFFSSFFLDKVKNYSNVWAKTMPVYKTAKKMVFYKRHSIFLCIKEPYGCTKRNKGDFKSWSHNWGDAGLTRMDHNFRRMLNDWEIDRAAELLKLFQGTTDADDSLWNSTSNKRFSVKSAYSLASRNNQDDALEAELEDQSSLLSCQSDRPV